VFKGEEHHQHANLLKSSIKQVSVSGLGGEEHLLHIHSNDQNLASKTLKRILHLRFALPMI
jgi:hypothetical protein